MRPLVRQIVLSLVVLIVCAAAIIPPEKNLRLGRDLAGGVSLVFNVELGDEDETDVVDQMIDVLRDRVNPRGLLEIGFLRQGRDRIEITMPLPSERVQRLRRDFEAQLERLSAYDLDIAAFERALRAPADRREAALEALMDSEPRRALLSPVVAAMERAAETRAAFEAALRNSGQADEAQEAELARLQDQAGEAAQALDDARAAVMRSLASPESMRIALELSDQGPRIRDTATKQMLERPSPRELAIKAIRDRIGALPGAQQVIDDIMAAHKAYADQRRGLDDPADLERLLQGAGVLDFRITVVPGASPEEPELRRQLIERGAEGVQSATMRWFPINNIETWYEDTATFQQAFENTAAYFSGRGYVVEQAGGKFFMLLHDEPGLRLTNAEGNWRVDRSFRARDEMGRPAIGFAMDPMGARLLGDLTEANRGRQMAIVLDDEVFTAPTLQSRISDRGQITGSFSEQELQYIIKTLNAGSLHAKLSSRPISKTVLAPELGRDNLEMGFRAAWIAAIAIGVFMVTYYFTSGAVAMIALLCNAIIVLGCMSLSRAAFTLPGIAGIILTFGTAVDANVLIYERIREEVLAGNDIRTAVRLAFNKVLSTIVDANVTNLIVCFVLAYVGTAEIRGFGITLGIGVVATMFCSLVVTRAIFTILVDHVRVKKLSQLPLVIPALQRLLTPKIDWIALRWVFVPLSVALVLLGLFMCFIDGPRLLDTEFRGGTAVTLRLKSETDDTGRRVPGTMTRSQVAERVRALGDQAKAAGPATTAEQSVLWALADAEVVPMNPLDDGVTSNSFKIKTPIIQTERAGTVGASTGVETDAEILQRIIVNAFSDVIDSRPALRFVGSDQEAMNDQIVRPVIDPTLGANIGRDDIRDDVAGFTGGVIMLLDNIEPPVTEEVILERIQFVRDQPQYASSTLKRSFRFVALTLRPDGTVEDGAVLIHDPSTNFSFDDQKWRAQLAAPEWSLLREALTRSTTLAGVESFSAEVAATFKAQAIVSIILCFFLVTVYVWVRFGSLRYSLAAILPLVHDVLITVGVIGLTFYLVEHFPWLLRTGLKAYKIDLGLTAAILTIIGFSLNDTIVILDRIREMRGKLAYASKQVINDAVNACMSRTIITSGTTIISMAIVFIFGGEGVASFAFAMLVGSIVGTYSTIAIAAPIVWKQKVPPPAPSAAIRRTPDAAPAALTSGGGYLTQT